jgi:hypothetical protein
MRTCYFNHRWSDGNAMQAPCPMIVTMGGRVLCCCVTDSFERWWPCVNVSMHSIARDNDMDVPGFDRRNARREGLSLLGLGVTKPTTFFCEAIFIAITEPALLNSRRPAIPALAGGATRDQTECWRLDLRRNTESLCCPSPSLLTHRTLRLDYVQISQLTPLYLTLMCHSSI